MEIDIRNRVPAQIDTIRIYDYNDDEFTVEYIERVNDWENHKVFISDKDTCDPLRIYNKEHALDIIKALDKAIELGWLK